MMKDTADPLIEVEELEALLKAKTRNLRLIDACYFLPKDPRKPEEEFAKETIPGAVFLHLDKVADTSSPYPHMMPSTEFFTECMKKLRVRKDDLIICFDHLGCSTAPRAWFTFRVFGAQNVRVLNGGIAAWKARGNPVEKDGKGVSEGSLLDPDKSDSYGYVKDSSRIRDLKDMHALIEKINTKAVQHYIVDARSAERFAGLVDEPRAGLRRGAMPGATNVFFKETFDLTGGEKMKPVGELKKLFAAKGIDLTKPITTTCGSGMTAAVVLFALHRAGAKDLSLYDGSWMEYV